MKKCSQCKKEKDLSCFNKKGDGLTARCKECLSVYYRAKAKEPERRKQVVRAVSTHRRIKRAWLNELKSNQSCTDCGNKHPHFVMDFDHRNPSEKEDNVSNLIRRGWSKDRILKEIAKCDLVCANCHRIRTHG